MTRERRSLWGSISISRKVNALSCRAALLYTWAISHFDDEGYQDADLKELKHTVVPFREDIPLEEMKPLVLEILGVHRKLRDSIPLWNIYHVENRAFIQDPVWFDRQTFQGIHIKESKIKKIIGSTRPTVLSCTDPSEAAHQRESIPQINGEFHNTDPSAVVHQTAQTPVPKLSKVKRREVKVRSAVLSPEPPPTENQNPPVSIGQVKTQTQDPKEMTEAEFEAYLKKSYPWANFKHEIEVIDRFIAKYPKVKKTRSLIIKHFNEVPKPVTEFPIDARKAKLHAQAKQLGVEKP